MQRLVHRATVRLAAALVAVALSGVVPWLEAPHAEPAHRCQCARGAGHHDCDCPLCHAEAARVASQASAGAKLPPCHLAKARKAEAEAREAAARRAASGPTLASSCGAGDPRFDPPPTAPLFTVPEAPALAIHVAVASLDDGPDLAVGQPEEPETPPPRQA